MGDFQRQNPLCLALEGAGGGNEGVAAVFGQADGAKRILVFADVVLQGEQQTLGVFGGEDDTALDLAFLYARQHAHEEKLCWWTRNRSA